MMSPGERNHDRHLDHKVNDTSINSGAVVVVGIDGSATSWDAFHWACGETRRMAGRTVAVFVGPTSAAVSASATASFAGAVGAYGAIEETVTDQAEELGDLIRRHGYDLGVDVTFIHTRGDTATELLRTAVSFHADLVVVGRSTKARHHVAGSLGRRLVGRRHAPVIVVVP
ncbi:MAG TPA: universal stress protein [Acidimicrobiales bacterium]|jgi:nucleotide-binding universal stress UspA family protein